MAKEENVYKVTLSSSKVVLLREFKMYHQELAIKAAGNRAGSNQTLQQFYMMQEIIKALVVQVDGADVDKNKIENLDNYFSVGEIAQIQNFLKQVGGLDEGSQTVPGFELVKISGSK